MASKPLNFAVIGCGMLARSQHIPNIAASSKTVLHTCCDLSDAALDECRDRYGAQHITKDFKAAIRDPDVHAICIATTEKLRVPLIEEAASAGKPVYCEKPLAQSLEQMYHIQDVVHAAGIPFCVGHNRRSSPAMLDAHTIFRGHMEHPKPCPWRFDREGAERPEVAGDGLAGMSVRVNDDWWSWKKWVFDKTQAPHGPMLFEMTHFTDLCNWFMASEPTEVVAITHDIFNSACTIKYADGTMATIIMNANGTFGFPKERYELFGNGAALIVDHMLEMLSVGIEGAPDRTLYPMINDRHPSIGVEGGVSGWLAKKRAACQEAVAAGDNSLTFTAEPDKGHARAMDRFVDEINGTGPEVCGVDAAISATEVAFAAIRSAEERRVVNVSELRAT